MSTSNIVLKMFCCQWQFEVLNLWTSSSSVLMLSQAFTSAPFSCCFFVIIFVWSLVFNKWNAGSIELKSGDWLGNSRVFYSNFWVALDHLVLTTHYISEIRINSAASVLGHTINKHYCSRNTHSHACPNFHIFALKWRVTGRKLLLNKIHENVLIVVFLTETRGKYDPVRSKFSWSTFKMLQMENSIMMWEMCFFSRDIEVGQRSQEVRLS